MLETRSQALPLFGLALSFALHAVPCLHQLRASAQGNADAARNDTKAVMPTLHARVQNNTDVVRKGAKECRCCTHGCKGMPMLHTRVQRHADAARMGVMECRCCT